MAEATTNANNTLKKEKLTMTFDEPMKFDGLIDTQFTDTYELCTNVNTAMRSVFADYYGSKIEINNRYLQMKFYFQENPNNPEMPHAIERTITKDGDAADKFDYINRLNGGNGQLGNRPNLYRLTQQGKELLEDIVPWGAKDSHGHVNWNKITAEGSFSGAMFQYGQNYAYFEVSVDVNRVIRKIYGAQDGKGNRYQYMITVGNPVNPINTPNGQIVSNLWQLFIIRLSEEQANKIAQKYGQVANNNIGIIH